MQVRRIVLLGLVHTALASIASTKKDTTTSTDAKSTVQLSNSTQTPQHSTSNATGVPKKIADINLIDIGKLKTRRKKERSTSSSSGEKDSGQSGSAAGSSLGISSLGSSELKGGKENKYLKYQNFEAKGWRRWHRKCSPCPADMVKKWRDPSIKWICGGYQRARRSFKSQCMMHYRNCQDGTMFVKIHDHRCANSTSVYPRGQHFLYDYKVVLHGDTSGSETSEISESEDTSSSELY